MTDTRSSRKFHDRRRQARGKHRHDITTNLHNFPDRLCVVKIELFPCTRYYFVILFIRD